MKTVYFFEACVSFKNWKFIYVINFLDNLTLVPIWNIDSQFHNYENELVSKKSWLHMQKHWWMYKPKKKRVAWSYLFIIKNPAWFYTFCFGTKTLKSPNRPSSHELRQKSWRDKKMSFFLKMIHTWVTRYFTKL